MTLTEKECVLFNKLLTLLLLYTNKVYDVDPELDLSFGFPDDMRDIMKVKDYLWDNDHILDDFVKDDPFGLSFDELRIVQSWKFHNTGAFTYAGEAEGLSVFADAYDHYGVSGLSKDISSVLDEDSAPVTVLTTLLPFMGRIVYDTTMAQSPIGIGPNMRYSLLKDFDKAKSDSSIITTSQGFIDVMSIPKDKRESMELNLPEEMQDSDEYPKPYEGLSHKEMSQKADELMKEFATEVADRVAAHFSKGVPQTDLIKILESKTKKELLDIAKRIGLKGINSCKKSDVIHILENELYDEDYVKTLLRHCDDDLLDLIDEILLRGHMMKIEKDQSMLLFQSSILINIVVYLYHHDGIVAVIPKEFAEVYSRLMASDFKARRSFDRAVHDYANAAVHIYGVISFSDFVSFWGKYNEEPLTEDDIKSSLCSFLMNDEGLYEVAGKDLVHFEITDDHEWAEYVKGRNKDIEMKEFPRETIEKYFKENYIPETKELSIIGEFIQNNAPEFSSNDILMESFMEGLYNSFLQNLEISEILKKLEHYNLVFDLDKTNALLSLIMNARNNNILWGNNGWTPSELSQKDMTPEKAALHEAVGGAFAGMASRENEDRHIPVTKEKKTGRNDPCPCGSGKKYKKCCMPKVN